MLWRVLLQRKDLCSTLRLPPVNGSQTYDDSCSPDAQHELSPWFVGLRPFLRFHSSKMHLTGAFEASRVSCPTSDVFMLFLSSGSFMMPCAHNYSFLDLDLIALQPTSACGSVQVRTNHCN